VVSNCTPCRHHLVASSAAFQSHMYRNPRAGVTREQTIPNKRTEQVAEAVKDAAPETKGEAKGQAQELAGAAKGKAQELKGEAKGKASELQGEANKKM
jgi:hypothetical protein